MAAAAPTVDLTAAVIGLLNLAPLMARTKGIPEVSVGLIDGPVSVSPVENIRQIPGNTPPVCSNSENAAAAHATALANLLVASEDPDSPALAPRCTLLVRPIFRGDGAAIYTSLEELAAAIHDCIDARASVLNLSLGLTNPALRPEHALTSALDRATANGVIVVAASGNHELVGGTSIVQHRWTIPVAACGVSGQPARYSNFGASVGRRGLLAPGVAPGVDGTSAAAAWVAGTFALLRSIFPSAAARHVVNALTGSKQARRSVVPPLLDGGAALARLAALFGEN